MTKLSCSGGGGDVMMAIIHSHGTSAHIPKTKTDAIYAYI